MSYQAILGRFILVTLISLVVTPQGMAQKESKRPRGFDSTEELLKPDGKRYPSAHQKYIEAANSGGYAHFDEFEERIYKHVEAKRSLLQRNAFLEVNGTATIPKYSQVYISTSYRTSPMWVLIARLPRNGNLEISRQLVSGGSSTSAAEIYSLAFGPKESDEKAKQQLVAEFNSIPLLVDASLFHIPTSELLPINQLGVSHKPSLKIDSTQIVELSWKTILNGVSRDFQLFSARSKKDNETYFYPILKPPALLGQLPPDGYREHIAEISKVEFDKRQLSIFMLEGNTDARRPLLLAALKKQISLAGDLTKSPKFGDSEMRELESAFAVRRGKTIAIVGHYENETFFIRSNGRTTGAIPRSTLLAWAAKYDVSLLLLGCETVNGVADSKAQTVTPINSVEMAHALIRASDANNWAEFFSSLSSKEAPILVLSPAKNLRNSNSAALLRRLPDGRLYSIARITYQIRCSVMATC